MLVNYTFNQKTTDCQNYYYFNNGFTKDELKFIEESVAKLPFHEAVTVGNNSKEVRSSRIKWLPQSIEWDWLYNKLGDYAVQANNALWNFNLYSMPEQIQYTEYLASEGGHYGWHQDIGPDVLSLRKISITVQLSDNDEYEGGDLEFNKGGDGGLMAPRGAGTVVIFPSYLMHRVNKITKGTRKSFVLWLGGEHYK
jgi:PKHD-type hydroxylase